MTKSTASRSPGRDTYQRIVMDIRSGVLQPGDRITETDLATRFGTSRTPVREAIRQLESDGLVIHTPRVGATLRQLDYAEISELYDMRAVLESTAARFAARAASDVELAELAALHESMVTTKDSQELTALNQHFHQALHNAARNRFLLRSVLSIHKTLLILGTSTMQEHDRALYANQEHAAILAALEARDPLLAESAMREHIEAAHQARLKQLRSRHANDSSTP